MHMYAYTRVCTHVLKLLKLVYVCLDFYILYILTLADYVSLPHAQIITKTTTGAM